MHGEIDIYEHVSLSVYNILQSGSRAERRVFTNPAAVGLEYPRYVWRL